MDNPNKFWIAYYGDYSEMAVFDTEIECLRYAVENSMLVDQVPFGHGVREYINRKPKN